MPPSPRSKTLLPHWLLAAGCWLLITAAGAGPAAPAPAPADVTTRSITPAHYNQHVRIRGIVRDAFRDDIDPSFFYMVVADPYGEIYATGALKHFTPYDFDKLVGAEVSAQGLCNARTLANRRQIPFTLELSSPADLAILSPAPDSRFSAPPVSSIPRTYPAVVPRLGRHSASGRVIAVWNRTNFLLASGSNTLVRVEIAGDTLPKFGELVQAVGFPETDLYRINLSRAVWRRLAASSPYSPPPPTPAKVSDILYRRQNSTFFTPSCHGKTVTLTGFVRNVPNLDWGDNTLFLDCGSCTVPVDLTSAPESIRALQVGCEAAISGVCVLDIDNWRPNAAFPRISGFFLAPRSPLDVLVLSRPSWFTPSRLAIVIAFLALATLAILAWNLSLRSRAERRGRQLLKAQISQVKSSLRVEERTRMAVELHDSLAQILTGVAMEIATAAELAPPSPPELATHVNRAKRMLKSGRDELRNCLWDLRSQALDDPSLRRAILRTLQPHLNGAALALDLSIPRSWLSDKTAHAIICIVRELVINAVRHGSATSIRVAGSITREALSFSVSDNGSGFDPSTRPGVLQGHYGLQGVSERIKNLNGALTLQTAPNQGAAFQITIPRK